MVKKANVRRPAVPAEGWPPNEAPFLPVNSASGADLQDAADRREAAAKVRRPADAGGEDNLAGIGLQDAGGKFVDLCNELDKVEEEAKAIKKRMALYEESLLEQMAAGDVQSLNVKGKTLYRQKDTIVSKAKGVSADELILTIKEVDWVDLVGETINASTLKATVKEAIRRADEAEAMGDQYYCKTCGRFEPVGLPPAPFLKGPKGSVRACRYCFDAGENTPLVAVKDGIPAKLKPLLYIEDHYKLGVRSSG